MQSHLVDCEVLLQERSIKLGEGSVVGQVRVFARDILAEGRAWQEGVAMVDDILRRGGARLLRRGLLLRRVLSCDRDVELLFDQTVILPGLLPHSL